MLYLVGVDIAGNQQVVVILDMEEATVSDLVCYPDRSTILSTIIDRTLVAFDALPAKSDDVSALK
jgi:hypothetical protein